MDVVELETTPVDQPKREDKKFGEQEDINPPSAGDNLHVDNTEKMFNEIMARSTVTKTFLPVLLEGFNRTRHGVATSRIAKRRAPAPLLTCKVCHITVPARTNFVNIRAARSTNHCRRVSYLRERKLNRRN